MSVFGLRRGWLRLWRGGPGLSWTDAPPLFAERYGYVRALFTVRGVRVRYLPPDRPRSISVEAGNVGGEGPSLSTKPRDR